VIRLSPAWGPGYFWRGRGRLQRDNAKGAVEDLEKALQLDGGHEADTRKFLEEAKGRLGFNPPSL